jgi:hypothetical protein
VAIEYESPPPGESQQFIRATPLIRLPVRLPPGGEILIPLSPELRGRVIGSVKAYFSHDPLP